MTEYLSVFLSPGILSHLKLVDFGFTSEQRNKILTALHCTDTDPTAAEFLKHAQLAMGRYQIRRSAAAIKAMPKETLSRLETLLDQVNQMLEALNNLDAEVVGLLRIAYQDPANGISIKIPPEPIVQLVHLSERLGELQFILGDLNERMRKQVHPGRITENVLRTAIYQVVEAYERGFSRLPPSTRDGAFEDALTEILKTVGIHKADLHKYVLYALAQARVQKTPSI